MEKILSLQEAIVRANIYKQQEKTIVLVGGCFDVLHSGHHRFLEAAKKEGDILFVALESDSNVRRLKGESRPKNGEDKRAKALARIQIIDTVFILPPFLHDTEYAAMTKSIAPDVIAITEGDVNENKKQEQAKKIGAKVITVTKRLRQFSTTQLVEKNV